jgi:hypothetical protein
MPVLDFKKLLEEYEEHQETRHLKEAREKELEAAEAIKDETLLNEFMAKLADADKVLSGIREIINSSFDISTASIDSKHKSAFFTISELKNTRRSVEFHICGIIDRQLKKRVVHVDRTLLKHANLKEQLRSLEIPINQYKNEYLEKIIYEVLQSFTKY